MRQEERIISVCYFVVAYDKAGSLMQHGRVFIFDQAHVALFVRLFRHDCSKAIPSLCETAPSAFLRNYSYIFKLTISLDDAAT